MSGQEPHFKRFYSVSYQDDDAEPTVSLGAFIPKQRKAVAEPVSYTPKSVKTTGVTVVASPYVRTIKVVTVFLSLSLFVLVSLLASPFIKEKSGTLVAQLMSAQSADAPVIVENPYSHEQTPLNYGVQMTFTKPNFFLDTRDAFIRDAKTFIEVDLAEMKLRFFKDGVLAEQMNVLSKGVKGSWWETPAGLYKIEKKEEKFFSNFGQVYIPWSMTFQGNFVIHGEPFEENGEAVPKDFTGGGVRLGNADAENLYKLARVDTPVLVYEKVASGDSFVYEPKIPELKTPHYLIADIESNTVLASSDLNNTAPIASITKLMTALVAAEYINLDKTVQVNEPSLVESMVPRLEGMSSVSMYSLLQLLLVESSNESAELIATQIGREKFIQLMNEKAKSIGLTHTKFADPSGLSAENTSSVGDLLGLIQYIYNNRRFIIELTAKPDLPSAYVGSRFNNLNNFNEVEGLQNFIGGKVGETTAAKQTSVTLHKIRVKGTERIIAIALLGSDGRGEDVKRLLGYAEERFGY